MAFNLGPRALLCAAWTCNAAAWGLMNINDQVSNVIPRQISWHFLENLAKYRIVISEPSQGILDAPLNILNFSYSERPVVNRTLVFPLPECYEHIENGLGNIVVVVNNAACFDDVDWKKLIDTNLVSSGFF